MNRKSIFVVLMVGLCVLTAAVAQADTILLTDSFEEPSFPGPGMGYCPVEFSPDTQHFGNWTAVQGLDAPNDVMGMLMYPEGNAWGYPDAYDGRNFASLDGGVGGGSWFCQKLTTDGSTPFQFTAGDIDSTLTLSVYSTYRSATLDGTLQIQLWADGLPPYEGGGAGELIGNSGPITILGGDSNDSCPDWELRSYTFTVTASDVFNRDLYIAFNNPTASEQGPTWNLLLDKASVVYSPASIPEPSTLALLAAGLVGLLAYAWRKRK